MKAFLDTHVGVALEEGALDNFGIAARDLLERAALFISPVVRLELTYLREIGRLTVPPDEILGGLATRLGIVQSEDPIASVVAEALTLSWTRDPFDRLLVATASLHRAPFITSDQRILENFADATW